MTVLETDDLILKPGSLEDWQDLHKNLWSRKEAFTYMFKKVCLSEEAGQIRTAVYVEMQQMIKTEYFVYEKNSGQAIGIAGLKELKPCVCTVTDVAIGPDFHRRGYGRQVVEALVKYAFEELNAGEVFYDCFQENEASRRLALACGFAYSHSGEAELLKDGKKVMLEYYRKLK